jgi:hypothetical protein
VSFTLVIAHVVFKETCHQGLSSGLVLVHVPGHAVAGVAVSAWEAEVDETLEDDCTGDIASYGIGGSVAFAGTSAGPPGQ